jgi:aminoglycoside phosphotransferase (APT) family kinase protein
MDSFSKIRDSVYDLTGFTDVKRIEKGYSFEKKYLLFGSDGISYLLRIAEIPKGQSAAGKKAEFEVIGRAGQYSELVPKAHYFGVSDDESICYMLLDYISGKDCEDAMVELSSDDQYSLGFDAGKELLKLHRLDAPEGMEEWRERYSSKYKRKCSLFDEYNINSGIVDMEKVSRFIRASNSNMECERQSFLHDDYHPGNLIEENKNLCGIIDFNRYDWGDPVHDFVKTAYFSSAVSIPFCVGQIDGYNGDGVSSGFWGKYSLYAAMTIVPDLVWSCWYSEKTGSPGQAELSEERVKRVFWDHDGFDSEVPLWYRDYKGLRD